MYINSVLYIMILLSSNYNFVKQWKLTRDYTAIVVSKVKPSFDTHFFLLNLKLNFTKVFYIWNISDIKYFQQTYFILFLLIFIPILRQSSYELYFAACIKIKKGNTIFYLSTILHINDHRMKDKKKSTAEIRQNL